MIWWMNLVPGVNIILPITNEKNTSNTEMMWAIEIIYVMHQPKHLCSQTVVNKWTNCYWFLNQISSVQFSCSVMSDSLRPHELQHARPPCPSPTPGVHSDSRQSSWWCHPAISSSVVPFSSCPQSLPESDSFPVSQLFTWGG